jgi:cephalosporin hydroxylase
VSPGSYIIVQDTNLVGPRAAVDAFLPRHSEFMVDTAPHKFLLTFYPGGYLKRKPTPPGNVAPSETR